MIELYTMVFQSPVDSQKNSVTKLRIITHSEHLRTVLYGSGRLKTVNVSQEWPKSPYSLMHWTSNNLLLVTDKTDIYTWWRLLPLLYRQKTLLQSNWVFEWLRMMRTDRRCANMDTFVRLENLATLIKWYLLVIVEWKLFQDLFCETRKHFRRWLTVSPRFG